MNGKHLSLGIFYTIKIKGPSGKRERWLRKKKEGVNRLVRPEIPF